MEPKRLRSECGQYAVIPSPQYEGDGTTYRLFRDGVEVGLTMWWSNRYTKSRIAFEVGCGEHKATFSYPRYPRWFHRRWVTCFTISCQEVYDLAVAAGAKVLDCGKADMNCWICLGFRGTPAVRNAVDAALTARGVEWSPRKKPGMWDIVCPNKERWATS